MQRRSGRAVFLFRLFRLLAKALRPLRLGVSFVRIVWIVGFSSVRMER